MTIVDSQHPLLVTWRTSSRVTSFLVEHLTDEVLSLTVPGAPRRTVRMLAGHLHNCRCAWVKMLGAKQGLSVPASVDRRRVTRAELLRALPGSSLAMERLLELGLSNDGRLPGFSPPDVTHFLAYHAAHEGHHRGQIVMVARQHGHRLPAEVTAGLWQWSKRKREARDDA